MSQETLSCPHAVECPGCPLHAVPYGAQLEGKRERLSRTLRAFHELRGANVAAVRGAEPREAYRSRAKLVTDGSRVGLFSHEGHVVLDLPGCRVLAPPLEAAARALRAAAPFHPAVRGFDLQCADEGVLLTVIAEQGTARVALQNEAERLAQGIPGVAGLALGLRPRGAAQFLARNLSILQGKERFRRKSEGSSVFAYTSHGAFSQVHGRQQAALQKAVLGLVRQVGGTGASVLELFAGSGALSLQLAAAGFRVTAVEFFEAAVSDLASAAKEQELPVEAIHGDAEATALRLLQQGRRFDVVVVNPPRRGLAPPLRVVLSQLGARALAYVSCCPETLARDVAHLAALGFSPETLEPYDMMPWTEQVETLSVLIPADLPPLEMLEVGQRCIAVVKPPHLPATPQGEYATSLQQRVRAQTGALEAVLVHRLDPTTSGVCLFARHEAHATAIERALSSETTDYIVLVRGVVRGKGVINRPLKDQGKQIEGRTRYKRLAVLGGHSLLRVHTDPGHRHQIRRHLASIGHPVLGDAKYGDAASNDYFFNRHGLDRPFVHCSRIVLSAVETQEFSAPLAADLSLVLQSLDPAYSVALAK